MFWPNPMEQHTPDPTVVSNPIYVERVSATSDMKPMNGTMTLMKPMRVSRNSVRYRLRAYPRNYDTSPAVAACRRAIPEEQRYGRFL